MGFGSSRALADQAILNAKTGFCNQNLLNMAPMELF
jgi:hypothetical protein